MKGTLAGDKSIAVFVLQTALGEPEAGTQKPQKCHKAGSGCHGETLIGGANSLRLQMMPGRQEESVLQCTLATPTL